MIDCDLTETQFESTDFPITYFDQDRLILAYYQASSKTGFNPDPSVYVVVCTPEGLAYAAHLVHSQSAAGLQPYTDLTLTPTA